MMNLLSFKLMQLARQGPALAVTPVFMPMYSSRSCSSLWVFTLYYLQLTNVFPSSWARNGAPSWKIRAARTIHLRCGRRRTGPMRLPRGWGLRATSRRRAACFLLPVAGKPPPTYRLWSWTTCSLRYCKSKGCPLHANTVRRDPCSKSDRGHWIAHASLCMLFSTSIITEPFYSSQLWIDYSISLLLVSRPSAWLIYCWPPISKVSHR